MNTPDDFAALAAIANADDDRIRVALVMAYWHDLERADRTPRSIAYLHLGLLAGMYDRLAAASVARLSTR